MSDKDNEENLTKIKFKFDGIVFREFYLTNDTLTKIRPRIQSHLTKKEECHNGIISGPKSKNILILRNVADKSLSIIRV